VLHILLERLIKFRREQLTAQALVSAFDRGGKLAFAFGGGFLVKLSGAQLGKQPGFFYGTLEAAHGYFKRLVFLNFDSGHEDAILSLKILVEECNVKKARHYISMNLIVKE